MNSKSVALSHSRTKGIVLVVIAAVLWAVSGIAVQYLFAQPGYTPEWLVVVRLLVSGILLLGLARKTSQRSIWKIWQNKQDVLSLLLFSIVGMLAVQYTYFLAIEHSNVATATVLQYLAPAIIFCYVAIVSKRLPIPKEILAVFLAVLGTFLLVTKGSIHSLAISGSALFWGISSAVTLAFYTLHPIKLLAKWGTAIIVGWGMLIGGACFSLIHPPWHFEGEWSLGSAAAVIFIIIFGTFISFYCYLASLDYISASEASLVACLEPLAVALLSVLLLHVAFGLAEWLGTLCIIGTIVILSFVKKQE